jgi:hypothetical protein
MESADGGGLIGTLNLIPDYNCSTLLNDHLNADHDMQLNINIGSNYVDYAIFAKKYANSKKPMYLSVNIQSLMSKFDQLKLLINDLMLAHVPIDVIALQETWSIGYPELVQLPGFQQIVFSERAGMRGGGIGFYIRDGLPFNKIDNLSTFNEKTFECLSVEVQYPNKKILLSNVYRSPNPPPRCSLADHMNQFMILFNQHLDNINNLNRDSYVFLDSNINLHALHDDQTALNYLNSIVGNGFVQVITRSTRIQGQSHSLIDHILINKNFGDGDCGTLISDISDHFINFQQLPSFNQKEKQKLITNRKFNAVNIDHFKLLLRGTCWQNVTNSQDVDVAFDVFWTEFSGLYEICFPLTTTKLNRNVHRINGFMTTGLLISRTTKNKLHKQSLIDPSPVNITKFKTYRNIFNTLIRKSKIKFYEDSLNSNVKNPKKTWEILKEVTIGKKQNKKIEKLSVGGEQISDPQLIAEEFNSFFTDIGKTISESVRPTSVDPIDLMPDYPDLENLVLTEVGPNFFM